MGDLDLTQSELKNLMKMYNNEVEWGEFLIGDLFEVYKSTGINKSKLTKGNFYEYITRTSKNNGVHSFTGKIENIKPNPENAWSVGLLQMDFFFRKKEWYSGQFVRYVKFKKQLSANQSLFITVSLNKLSKNLKEVFVRNFDNHFLNSTIKFPVTTDGSIDYEFIEDFTQAMNKIKSKQYINHLKTLTEKGD